jgi:hypothetical protein
VGLATHHDCHTLGDKSKSDSFVRVNPKEVHKEQVGLATRDSATRRYSARVIFSLFPHPYVEESINRDLVDGGGDRTCAFNRPEETARKLHVLNPEKNSRIKPDIRIRTRMRL